MTYEQSRGHFRHPCCYRKFPSIIFQVLTVLYAAYKSNAARKRSSAVDVHLQCTPNSSLLCCARLSKLRTALHTQTAASPNSALRLAQTGPTARSPCTTSTISGHERPRCERVQKHQRPAQTLGAPSASCENHRRARARARGPSRTRAASCPRKSSRAGREGPRPKGRPMCSSGGLHGNECLGAALMQPGAVAIVYELAHMRPGTESAHRRPQPCSDRPRATLSLVATGGLAVRPS